MGKSNSYFIKLLVIVSVFVDFLADTAIVYSANLGLNDLAPQLATLGGLNTAGNVPKFGRGVVLILLWSCQPRRQRH